MKLTAQTIALKKGETALIEIIHHDAELSLVVDDQYINCSQNQTRIAEELREYAQRRGRGPPPVEKPGTTYIILHSKKERTHA